MIADNRTNGGPAIEYCDAFGTGALEPELKLALISIVQELLRNARIHSKSKRVLLAVTQNDARLGIQVQDWGIGFDPQNAKLRKGGLHGIRDIVGWLGGVVRIYSQETKGTCVMIDLPVGIDFAASVTNSRST
jgi:signal transduction histidine kinase